LKLGNFTIKPDILAALHVIHVIKFPSLIG